MDSMINWPVGDGRYHDTGEGGMYAFLVVPSAESDTEDACIVDVALCLTRPDVCVSGERELWEPFNYHTCGATRLHHVRSALERTDQKELNEKLVDLIGEDDLSTPLRAAVFLGSTSASLATARGGGYFQATRDDLTPAGETLYDVIHQAYGTRPRIATFLDT
jgi:hypothetical protein